MRTSSRAGVVGLTVVVLASCGGGGDGGAGPPKLVGTVGAADDPDAHEIRLVTGDGAEVTTVLAPGEYVLELDDRSTVHNFHLEARRTGVDVSTEVAGTGQTTATVVLQDGEAYIYSCDAHPQTMHVTFSIHGPIRTQN